MIRHIRIDSTSLKGALTLTPSICWKALCRVFTSVVMRVMSPEMAYLSMSEKASRWMLRYIAERRLAANPVEAYAEQRPPRMPNTMLIVAMPNMIVP